MSLSTESVKGKLTTNPYDFRHNNISSVIVTTESEFQSVTQQIKVDSGQSLEAYRSLNTLVSNPDIGNGITRNEFEAGNFFVAFDIRPRNSQNTMLTAV